MFTTTHLVIFHRTLAYLSLNRFDFRTCFKSDVSQTPCVPFKFPWGRLSETSVARSAPQSAIYFSSFIIGNDTGVCVCLLCAMQSIKSTYRFYSRCRRASSGWDDASATDRISWVKCQNGVLHLERELMGRRGDL